MVPAQVRERRTQAPGLHPPVTQTIQAWPAAVARTHGRGAGPRHPNHRVRRRATPARRHAAGREGAEGGLAIGACPLILCSQIRPGCRAWPRSGQAWCSASGLCRHAPSESDLSLIRWDARSLAKLPDLAKQLGQVFCASPCHGRPGRRGLPRAARAWPAAWPSSYHPALARARPSMRTTGAPAPRPDLPTPACGSSIEAKLSQPGSRLDAGCD